MTDLLCKKCGHEFQAEAFGHLEAMCPRCGWTVPAEFLTEPVTPVLEDQIPHCSRCEVGLNADDPGSAQTWDGKPYCRSCLDETGVGEFTEQPLEETVHFRLGSAFLRGFWSYFYLTATMASLLTGLVSLLWIAAIVGGQLAGNDPLRLMFGVVVFWGGSFLFVSLVTLPMSMLPAVFSRRIQFRVENGEFVVTTSFRTQAAKLSDCNWQPQAMGRHTYGVYLPRNPVIQVQMLDRECAACGFSDEMRRLWAAYFSLVNVPRLEQVSWGYWIRQTMQFVAGGGTLGASLGYMFSVATGDPRWITAWMFTGFLDGFVLLLYDVAIARKAADRFKENLHPLIAPLLFAACGAKAAGQLGWNGFIVCGSVNAVFGLLIALYLRKRIAESQAEQAIDNLTLDSQESVEY